jgi:uncharacterized GH25 family protein
MNLKVPLKRTTVEREGSMITSGFRYVYLVFILIAIAESRVLAHDIWIEPGGSVVRVGEPVLIQFKLGNCADGRPDGKVNGQLSREAIQAAVCLPNSIKFEDLTHLLSSSTQSEDVGAWLALYRPQKAGCTWFVQTFEDNVVHGGKKVRGKMFACTPMVVSENLGALELENQPVSFSQPFEIVLQSSVLPSMESKELVAVKVLRRDRPQENIRVAFTRLAQRTPETAVDFVTTNSQGQANWLPTEPGPMLISCTLVDEQESGKGFEATYYSATICLNVSQKNLCKVSHPIPQ